MGGTAESFGPYAGAEGLFLFVWKGLVIKELKFRKNNK
jgi:hypothetical protein